MDAAYSIAKDVFSGIWSQTAPAINHWRNFEENIKQLKNQFEFLQNEKKFVNSLIDNASREEGKVKTLKADLWLLKVNKAEAEVRKILRKNVVKAILQKEEEEEDDDVSDNVNYIKDEAAKTMCVNGYFSFSRMNLSAMAVNKCDNLKELISNRPLEDVLVQDPPPETVVARPYQKLEGGGAKQLMDDIWKLLVEEGWKMIGVHGQAKVGKTVLMENVTHMLGKTREKFDRVIYVKLEMESRVIQEEQEVCMAYQLNEVPLHLADKQIRMNQEEQQVRMAICKIQETIASRFRDLDLQGDEDNRGQRVFNRLKDLRFVLILDNVGYALDLRRIGVPDKDNTEKGSKVVVITRDKKVCKAMRVDDTFEVKPLLDDEAWKLFRETAWPSSGSSTEISDKDRLSEDLVQAAKELAKECDGVPGEIITLARFMNQETDANIWIDALKRYKQSKVEMLEASCCDDDDVVKVWDGEVDLVENLKEKEAIRWIKVLSAWVTLVIVFFFLVLLEIYLPNLLHGMCKALLRQFEDMAYQVWSYLLGTPIEKIAVKMDVVQPISQ